MLMALNNSRKLLSRRSSSMFGRALQTVSTPGSIPDTYYKSTEASDFLASLKNLPNVQITERASTSLMTEKVKDMLIEDLAAEGLPDLTVPVFDFFSGEPTDRVITLDEHLFYAPLRSDLVFDSLAAFTKRIRFTKYKGKRRSEVSGGGKKPWKQKGTGRARARSIRSPLWKGGGKAHAPVVRNWRIGIPVSVRRLAFRTTYASKFQDRRLFICDEFKIPTYKTFAAVDMLLKWGLENKQVVLIDADGVSDLRNMNHAFANIEKTYVRTVNKVDIRTLAMADAVVLTEAAAAQLAEKYALVGV